MPDMPSCTVTAVFGIARTTGTPSPSRPSMRLVGIAAAIVMTVCSFVSVLPTSARSDSMSCGFTAMTTTLAPAAASTFERVVSMPCRSESSASRSSWRAVAAISDGLRQPEDRRPAMSASPDFPAPRTAIFRLAMGETLSQLVVEVHRRADEREVREGLREVPELLSRRADLLREEPEMVRVREHLLEGVPRLLEPPGAGERLDVPEGAHRECALLPVEPVG